jgi:transcription elongation factor Elf1
VPLVPPKNPKGRDIRERVDKQRVEEKRFKHQQFENELGKCPICGHPTLRLERSKQLMFIHCTSCFASDRLPLCQGWENADYHSEFLHRVLAGFYQLDEQSALESISPDDIPNKIFYCLVKFNRREIAELRRYAKKFSKHIKIMTRKYVYHKGMVGMQRTVRRATGYAYMNGNLATINTIVNYMRKNDVRLEIIKTSLSYRFIKNYRFSNATFKNR